MKYPLLALLTISLHLGCDTPETSPEEVSEGAAGSVLAKLERDDFTFKFTHIPGGGVVVSEVGPIEQPSYLMYMIIEHDATPMEMYLALEPDGEAPEELQIDHARHIDTAPRSLSLPDISFRSSSAVKYGANCSLASDGGWFDAAWLAAGYPFHWYYQGSAVSKTSTSRYTDRYISHLCNYSVTPNSGYGIRHRLDGAFLDITVNAGQESEIWQGERSVISVADLTHDWYGKVAMSPNHTGNYKFGAMAE